MNLPSGLSAGFGKRFKEIVAVHVAQENILALISPAHDMIHCAGKFQSQLAWHGQRIGPSPLARQAKEVVFYGLTPLR